MLIINPATTTFTGFKTPAINLDLARNKPLREKRKV